jgi:uncharacterized protein YicC (UPF0701 family)
MGQLMGSVASMTGFGRAVAEGERRELVVEVRSLNHRFLEIAVKLPRGLSPLEPDTRRQVQARLTRGRIDVTVAARGTGGSRAVVRTDLPLAQEYVRSAHLLRDRLRVPGELSLAELLRLPGVLAVEDPTADEEAAEAWTHELQRDLPGALQRIRDRVCGRIAGLLQDGVIDPTRILQEAATWAVRSDVAEEVARVVMHCAQFRSLLDAGGSIGRRLDFLAQELHREVNTIAAKVDDAQLITGVLDGRAVVERIREQVQNVE